MRRTTDGRRRTIAEERAREHAATAAAASSSTRVSPSVDCGAFPIKRIVGDTVDVEAVVYADGHDAIAVALLHRREADAEWTEAPMEPLGNDRWRASFTVDGGRPLPLHASSAWVDRFATWPHDLAKRLDAGQDVAVDLLVGAALVEAAAARATGRDARAPGASWPPRSARGGRRPRTAARVERAGRR